MRDDGVLREKYKDEKKIVLMKTFRIDWEYWLFGLFRRKKK
jgi:hypothetical protein